MPSPVIAVDDVLEIVHHCYTPSQAGLMVWHQRVISLTAGTPRLEHVAERVFADTNASIRPLLSAVASYRGVSVRRVLPGPATAAFFSPQASLVGTGDLSILPTQVSGLLKKTVAQPGPSGRGRAYVPFPGEIHNTSQGVPDPTYLTLLENLAIVFRGIRTYTVLPPGTESWFAIYGILSPSTGLFSDIETVSPRTRWATQRRRGAYGKTNTPPW